MSATLGTAPAVPETIFDQAIAIADEQARAAYLDRVCAGNADLRRQAQRLVQDHFLAGGFLEQPAIKLDATCERAADETSSRLGAQIGPYTLLEQIGEGGMGLVYLAKQREPLERIVALKVIKPGMDSAQVIARFEAERQALAMMDHPNIARVLDAGQTAAGRPYFVMEVVRGAAITDYCDAHHLSPRERLELFVPVCQAVQHAHQKGIIHRDIKPSNVLVSEQDGRPVVKVIDFGIAKALGPQLTDKTIMTGLAQIVGTPLYMSPEQADLNRKDIDTRTDVYSLGVLLYELLTGTTPFDKERLKAAAFDEIRRIIREDEPAKPSSRLIDLSRAGSSERSAAPRSGGGGASRSVGLSYPSSLASVAALRKTDPSRLTRLVRGELDWIVMKALEKDRARRYETASGLAVDVQRYLADEPVQACAPSAGYRLRKFARRNKAILASVAVVFTTLAAGTALATWQAVRATKAEGLAQELLKTATANYEEAERQRQAAKAQEIAASEQSQIALAKEKIAREQKLLAQRRFYSAQMNLAARSWEDGDTPRVLELLETQRPRFDETDLRSFEWYALWQLCNRRVRFTRQARRGFKYSVAYSPDASMLALGSTDGSVTLLDASSGREVKTLHGGDSSANGVVAFSPDGTLLAQGCGSTRMDVTLWNVATGSKEQVLNCKSDVYSVGFSADGKTLATGTSGGTISLWNPGTGLLKARWQSQPVLAVGFSPDGRLLATSTEWGRRTGSDTRLWDITVTPPRLVRGLEKRGNTLAFSADGKRFAVGEFGGFALYDTETWTEIPVKIGPWGHGRSLTFVPDRDAIAVAVDARSVKIVDLHTGVAETLPYRAIVESLAVASGGKSAAAIDGSAVLKVWDLGPGARPGLIDVETFIGSLALSADGDTLAVGSGGLVRLFDLNTGAFRAELTGHSRVVGALAFSRNGKFLAAGSALFAEPGELKTWDLGSAKELSLSPQFKSAAMAVAIAPDDRSLATGGPQGELALFDLGAANPRAQISARMLTALTYSPDGKLLITAGAEGAVALRDPESGAEKLKLESKEVKELIFCLACSPDGKLLAAGNNSGLIYLWELPSGRLHATLRGNSTRVNCVGFLAKSKTLAASNAGGEVRFWDVATGQERITLRFGDRMAISADGTTLAAGASRAVQLLRASTAPEALAPKDEFDFDDPQTPVAQIADGERLLAAGQVLAADDIYHKAWLRLEQLASAFPENPGYRETWAQSLGAFAEQSQRAGQPQAAETHFRQAIAVWRKLIEDFPADHFRLEHLANAYRGLAFHLRNRKREHEEAAEHLHAALDVFDKLVADYNLPKHRHGWSEIHRALTGLLFSRARDAAQDAELSPIERQAAAEAYRNQARTLLRDGIFGHPHLVTWTDFTEFPEAEPLFIEKLVQQSDQPLHEQFERSNLMRQFGLKYLQQSRYAEAETLFRICLSIREAEQPDSWLTFDTKARLGGCLLGQQKFGEAEPLLLGGYEGLKQREAQISEPEKSILTDTLRWLVALYVGWSQGEKADPWRQQWLSSLAETERTLAASRPETPAEGHALVARYERIALELKELGRPEDAEKTYRTAVSIIEGLLSNDRSQAWYREQLGHSYRILIGFLVGSGRWAEKERLALKALEVFEKLAADDPEKFVYPYFAADTQRWLGDFIEQQNRFGEAEQWYRKSVAGFSRGGERFLKFRHSDLHESYRYLTLFLKRQGRLAEAATVFREKIELFQRLAAANPDEAELENEWAKACASLGESLRESGKTAESAAAFQQAIEHYQDNEKAAPAAEIVSWQQTLGQLHTDSGQFQDADRVFKKVVELREKMAAEFPQKAEFQRELFYALWQRAELLSAKLKQYEEAEPLYRLDHDILEKLIAVQPGEKIHRQYLGHCLWRLAAIAERGDRLGEAEALYRQSLTTFEGLAAEVPAFAFYRQEHGYSHWQLGFLLSRTGRPHEAAESYRQAARIYEQLAADVPNEPEYRSRHIRSLTWLAQALLAEGQPAEAGVAYSQILEITPQDAMTLNNLAWLLATCADSQVQQPQRAIEIAQRAVELTPNEGMFWNTLGVARYRAGDFQAAIDALNTSMERRKTSDSFDWFFLAMARWQLGEKKDALQWFEKAVEWMEKNQPKNAELIRFKAEAEQLSERKEQPQESSADASVVD